MATAVQTKRPATVASTCRKLILEGKTDKQIWSVLKKQFQIDDSKQHYIGWYRAEVKRKGLDQPKTPVSPPPPPPATQAKPARGKAKAPPAPPQAKPARGRKTKEQPAATA